MKELDWFISRVGKRITRDASSCKCKSCNDAVEKGFIVADIEDAKSIYYYQVDVYVEGDDLNYRDFKN